MQFDRLEIRFAEAADTSTLAGLMLEANRHYWGAWDGASAMTAASAQAMIAGQSGCKAIIAWQGGLPIAFATVSVLHPAPSEHGTLFMKDLFVTENARGTGVGTHVMRHLAGLAMKLGCQRFDWTAETDNPRALAFYDRLGATRVEEKVYFRFSAQTLASLAAEPSQDGDT
ncbi:MAG: GNAT family N-acetyltransferase [Pseudomonadota bacterium]